MFYAQVENLFLTGNMLKLIFLLRELDKIIESDPLTVVGHLGFIGKFENWLLGYHFLKHRRTNSTCNI